MPDLQTTWLAVAWMLLLENFRTLNSDQKNVVFHVSEAVMRFKQPFSY